MITRDEWVNQILDRYDSLERDGNGFYYYVGPFIIDMYDHVKVNVDRDVRVHTCVEGTFDDIKYYLQELEDLQEMMLARLMYREEFDRIGV